MADKHDALLEALLSALLLSLVSKLAWKRCFAEADELKKRNPTEQCDPDGCENGSRKGYEDGFEEGYRQGAAVLLRAALRARFGPLPADIVAKVNGACLNDTLAWLRRTPKARDLADVFRCDHPALVGHPAL